VHERALDAIYSQPVPPALVERVDMQAIERDLDLLVRAARGPGKELPARGIARTRAVLSRRLACCQSEAAWHHVSGLDGTVCP
jgi:hypothetical protein